MMHAGAKYSSMLQLDPAIQAKVADAITQIREFQKRWDVIERTGLNKLQQLSALLNAPLPEKVAGQQDLSNDEKADVLNAVLQKEDRDVAKYSSAFDAIIQQFGSAELSLNVVSEVHAILMHVPDAAGNISAFRTIPVVTDLEFPPGMVRKYERDDWQTIPESLQQLIDWVNNSSTAENVDPVMVCGLFMYEFLSIHPFIDGNGRTARMITTLLLLKYGFSFAKYAKLEFAIQRRKLWCINALIKDQHYRNTDREILNSWLPFFTDVLLLMTRDIDSKYANLS